MPRTRPSFPSFLSVPLALVLALQPAIATGDDDPLLVKSREITASFASEMQMALQGAMATGGPIAAISACKDTAPEIAARLSLESGAAVNRTSLRVRNPVNTPLSWQTNVLSDFENDGATDEFFERSGNKETYYMKAIPTGALCLNCHGTVLPADIRKTLDQEYPDDQARDYYLGDIRGAFSVIWPAQE